MGLGGLACNFCCRVSRRYLRSPRAQLCTQKRRTSRRWAAKTGRPPRCARWCTSRVALGFLQNDRRADVTTRKAVVCSWCVGSGSSQARVDRARRVRGVASRLSYATAEALTPALRTGAALRVRGVARRALLMEGSSPTSTRWKLNEVPTHSIALRSVLPARWLSALRAPRARRRRAAATCHGSSSSCPRTRASS